MGSHMDPQLVEKIVHEVKSQGAFDEFRKDSMADVDTKPAYQNLRQRVENTVKKFLSEQRWTPETNKYQLRERLRKHITESGFLDVGVERIVDQVVNPKIGSVFQPRIEEIAYKYLGVPPPPVKCEPPPPIMPPLPPLPLNGAALNVDTSSLLPNDLEQVSPDSDKATLKSEFKDEEQSASDMDVDDKTPDDDDESPPFEPLIKCASPIKPVDMKNVKCDSDMETSNDNVPEMKCKNVTQPVNTETQYNAVSVNMNELDSEKEVSGSFDIEVAASQESQLSQVSSDSQISSSTPIASHSFIENSNAAQSQAEEPQGMEVAAENISEEAQMPKFNENSSDTSGGGRTLVSQLHFDIKKDEIKFEGTERKASMLLGVGDGDVDGDVENGHARHDDRVIESLSAVNNGNAEITEPAHQSSSMTADTNITPTANATPTPTAQDSSFGSSLEDANSQQCLIGSGALNEMSVAITSSQPREGKEASTSARGHSSSSSSSRHKKHSKDKRRSHDDKVNHKSKDKDKDKDKDKERERGKEKNRNRERSRDGSSKSKHSTMGGSSSNSKRSSSSTTAHTFASSSGSKNGKSVTTKHSTQMSTSSSSSSSRSDAHDTKRDKRDVDKKHERIDSTRKKSERKSETVLDDHNAAKDRTQRRKSTDSNDEDKSDRRVASSTGNSSVATTQSQKSSSGKNKSKNNNGSGHSTKSSKSEGKACPESETRQLNENFQVDDVDVDANGNECMPPQRRNKVVILNDILQNPSTDFVTLESTVAIVRKTDVSGSTVEETVDDNKNAVKNSENDLLFLEEVSGQFAARLRLLDHAMDRCRQVVNNLRFDCATSGAETPNLPDDNKAVQTGVLTASSEEGLSSSVQTRATLAVECMQAYCSDDDGNRVFADRTVEGSRVRAASEFCNVQMLPRKRSKRDDSCMHDKSSPTPSDTSVNSKENVVFEKNADDMNSAVALGRRSIAISKLNQQRYSSEDLYKPRPILSQRSRRRGVDPII